VAEATWLRGQVTLNIGGVTAPLEADTPFQGSGHFVATRAIERLDGATTLQLRLNAGGRAPFGEILALALSAG
jgi:hypothetical protein